MIRKLVPLAIVLFITACATAQPATSSSHIGKMCTSCKHERHCEKCECRECECAEEQETPCKLCLESEKASAEAFRI